MIEDLIKDLAYDTISLSQGLTRTKLLQSKLKIDELKNWLTNELNGYSNQKNVPDYRIVNVKIVGHFVGPFGKEWRNVPLMLDELGKSLDINFYEHAETGSIKAIEDAVSQVTGEDTLMIPLPQGLVNQLAELYKKNDPNAYLISAGKIVLPSEFRNIVDQTKQRLLDILIDLQEKFPTMDNKFIPTKENKEQAKNIVNYYVYGNSNNTNLGVGESVVQSENKQVIKSDLKEFHKLLEKLRVPSEEIETIKEIVKSKEPKPSKLSKAMKWIGQLSTKMVTKGIELKLPEIIEATEQAINNMS